MAPDKENDDETFSFHGTTLDADGTLEPAAHGAERGRRGGGRTPTATLPPPPAPLPVPPEQLELVDRARHAQTDYVAPPPPPRARLPTQWPSPWLPLLVLVLLAGGGWFVWGKHWFPSGPRPAAVVLITSEPAGSTVRIDGKEVGTTPWAADNIWGPGPVKVEVSRPGYRTWTGSFNGGGTARLEAQLQRR